MCTKIPLRKEQGHLAGTWPRRRERVQGQSAQAGALPRRQHWPPLHQQEQTRSDRVSNMRPIAQFISSHLTSKVFYLICLFFLSKIATLPRSRVPTMPDQAT